MERQFEGEGSAATWAVAVHEQGAAHFSGSECPAMQAETMAVLTGRKAVGENSREVFWRNADAVICHPDSNEFAAVGYAYDDMLVRAQPVIARVFCIPDKVHQDLHDLMPVDGDDRSRLELAHEADVVARKRSGVDSKAVLDQIDDANCLADASQAGVPLLNGDDLFHVLDVLAQLLQLGNERMMLGVQLLRELCQKAW
jgi:hypothetical protein